MFLRVVRAAGGAGVTHEYVRVVEAFREKGKLNLGRRDVLAAHLDLGKLTRLLHGEAVAAAPASELRPDQVQAVAAWDWGPILVARHLWRELGLETTLDRLSKRRHRDASTLSDRALLLVVNRLTAPGSEHGLARWLETDFVCDRDGRRWVAQWREEARRKASRTPRVQVELRQLKQWYRTLDQLLERKPAIRACAVICSRCRSMSCSTISPRPISKARDQRSSARMATAAMASRATRRCWSAWSWSTAGRSRTTCSPAIGAMP